MPLNPYDFSFVLRKQLQKKILNIFLIFVVSFLVITLIFSIFVFPMQVGNNAMNPEYPDNSLVLVAPCNFSKPLFFQNQPLTIATAFAVFSRISSGVPFIIQLPPQATILSKARYSSTFSAEIPPVGMNFMAGNAAESALMVESPPKFEQGKNLTISRP